MHSYDRQPLYLDIDLELAADFEPMLAIRGIVPVGAGNAVAGEPLERGVRFAVHGRDGLHRATTVTADRPCERGDRPGTLRFALSLAPGAEETIELRYALYEGEAPSEGEAPPARQDRRARRAADAWLAERTIVETDDELFNRILRRSLLDIRMLHSRRGADGYYAAGVPWYATLFGRDSLITALPAARFRLADGRADAAGARRAAGRRATTPPTTRSRARSCTSCASGEVARLGLSPLARYYGTVDATPLFLCLLCEHADWTGDLSLFRELRGPVDAMLGWIDGPGDRDGDGLLEYRQRAQSGLRNQGWKDSDEGVLDERGAPLEPPDRPRRAAGLRLPRQAPARASCSRSTATRSAPARCAPTPRRCASGSSASGSPTAASTRWASAPTAARARRWPPTRATSCGRSHSRRRAPRRYATPSCRTPCSPAGGCGRSPRARRATTRSGTTSAPSGRTTRPWPRSGCASTASTRDFERDLRGAARGGLARRGLPPAGAVRRLLPDGVRDARALPRRLPAAGLGRRRDPLPGHVRARTGARRAAAPPARSAAHRCRGGSTASRCAACGSPGRPSTSSSSARDDRVALTDTRIDGDVEVVLEIAGTRDPVDPAY